MQALLLFSMPSGGELILIAFVALLLFGGRKIPELMRGLGRGIREFNDAKNGVKEEIEGAVEHEEQQKKIQAQATEMRKKAIVAPKRRVEARVAKKKEDITPA